MYHEPVCCKCQIPMYPRRNGVLCVDVEDERLLKIIASDKWRCPSCHTEILLGFPETGHLNPSRQEVDEVLKKPHTTFCDFGTKYKTSKYLDEKAEWEKEENPK